MRLVLAAVLVWAGVAGCDEPKTRTVVVQQPEPATQPKASRVDLLANVAALPRSEPGARSVGGIAVGDPRSAINPADIVRNEPEGKQRYIRHKNGCQYVVEGDKVVAIDFHVPDLTKKLGIGSQKDVERVFGEADEVTNKDGYSIYWYEGKGLSVTWWAKNDSPHVEVTIVE